MKEHEFSPFEYDWKWDDTKQVLRVTERKPSATEWVKEVLEHCNCDREICISSVGRYVYVCDNAGQMAKACCAITDTFNKDTGIAIAYARLRHFPIHPAFKPQSAPKQKLLTLRGRRFVKKDSRVWDKANKKWGTVIEDSTAACTYLKVRWDEFQYDCVVPKHTVLLAITGES